MLKSIPILIINVYYTPITIIIQNFWETILKKPTKWSGIHINKDISIRLLKEYYLLQKIILHSVIQNKKEASNDGESTPFVYFSLVG